MKKTTEQCVQSLTEDLENKRLLLSHFTNPAGKGQRGGGDSLTERTVSAAVGADRETMESLLEAKLLENIRLKRDMRRMGEELSAHLGCAVSGNLDLGLADGDEAIEM